MNFRTLRILTSLVVLFHLLGNLWHGDAHTTLAIDLSAFNYTFVIIVIIVAPLVGALLTWTRFALAGCWLVGLSLLGSLLFSVYYHYIFVSIDNVRHLPPGPHEVHLHFSNSALFIALTALLGLLLAFTGIRQLALKESGARPSPHTL